MQNFTATFVVGACCVNAGKNFFKLVHHACTIFVEKQMSCSPRPMIGENWQLVTNVPFEFEK